MNIEQQMEHIECDQAISKLRKENADLRALLEAAFSDLNLYWHNDFENRGLAIGIRKALGKS
jgi:hypothetical protein